MFVGTWNVGGKSPNENLDLKNWLISTSPADIYVIGYFFILTISFYLILSSMFPIWLSTTLSVVFYLFFISTQSTYYLLYMHQLNLFKYSQEFKFTQNICLDDYGLSTTAILLQPPFEYKQVYLDLAPSFNDYLIIVFFFFLCKYFMQFQSI